MPELLERALATDGIEQLDRRGYAVARGLFSPREVDEIREKFMALAADGPVEGLSDFKHGGGNRYDPADPLSAYPRMMNPHSHPEFPVGPLAKRYMLDSRLRPILEAGMGDEPVAVQSMFYFKPPGARGQDLHQDNYYLRVAPGTCLAAWLSIDDSDAENGGMMVVPGSNHLDIACPERTDATKFFTNDHVDVPAGLCEQLVPLKAGDVLFFNGSLIHGSYPNTSPDRFRRSLIFHYVPRSSRELANWYHNPTTFDGEIIRIDAAQGGGPCGVAQPMGPH